MALVAPGMVEPMVLANQAGYGLITGICRAARGALRSGGEANGREWRQPVEFLGGEPMSLLLTDGPDGPRAADVAGCSGGPRRAESPGHHDARGRRCGGRTAGENACRRPLGRQAGRGLAVGLRHRGHGGSRRAGAIEGAEIRRRLSTLSVIALVLALTVGAGWWIARAVDPRVDAADITRMRDNTARSAGHEFLDDYVESDGRVVRRDEGGDVVSEGQAYGMLIAVAVGDEARFRAIWQWTKTHLRRGDGLLAWRLADD